MSAAPLNARLLSRSHGRLVLWLYHEVPACAMILRIKACACHHFICEGTSPLPRLCNGQWDYYAAVMHADDNIDGSTMLSDVVLSCKLGKPRRFVPLFLHQLYEYDNHSHSGATPQTSPFDELEDDVQRRNALPNTFLWRAVGEVTVLSTGCREVTMHLDIADRETLARSDTILYAEKNFTLTKAHGSSRRRRDSQWGQPLFQLHVAPSSLFTA